MPLRAVQLGHDERCHARYIPVAQLDELVWQDLSMILRQPELITEAFTRAHGGAFGEHRSRQSTGLIDQPAAGDPFVEEDVHE